MRDGPIYIEYMALTDLAARRWSANPKDHDIGLMHQLFQTFGYVAPAGINEENGELLWGHGRIKTAMQKKASGDPPPERIVVKGDEWYLPVVRGIALDPDLGHRYVVADNRATERGGWEEQRLADVLAEIAAQGEVEQTGFDADDVDQLLRDLQPRDYSDFEKEMEETEGLEEIRIHIVVPKKYADDVKAWLANGEELTGPGMGRGVLFRCGLI